MDYKYAGDFTKCPTGAFTEANKRLVWPGLTYDADKAGKHFSIVDDSRFPGGRACRMKYPKGEFGMKDQFYQIRIKSPQSVSNLEFMWLWEDGFSFYSNVPGGDGGGGKLSPCINHGEVGGEESKRGTRCMIWFNSHGSHKDNECHNPSCQDQRTGNQLIQPVVYSKKIVTNAVYKFRIQCKGGPGGYAKYWITYPGEKTETLLGDTGIKDLQVTFQDDVLYDFAFFSGGASPAYSPEHDLFARHGGVRYWSGEAYWAADGTTPPVEPPVTPPVEPPVTPPSGNTSRYSIGLGETKIFRAHFLDTSVFPAKEVPPGAAVKWSLSPNNVSWGVEAGPNWSGIQVKGKTVGGPCVLIATDPSTGLKTEPVNVDVTQTPQPEGADTGICTVEPLSGRAASEGKFEDEPPQ